MNEPGDVVRTWDVATLDIKPGTILVIRWHRAKFPGVGGNLAAPADQVEKVLNKAQSACRAALDEIGLTRDKVPILTMTEDWEMLLMRPLDLMDACATAAKNEGGDDGDSG